MLIDTHAHLSDGRFDVDRDLAIKRASDAGVAKIIEIGCEPYTWKASVDLAERNPGIYFALGIHPHEAVQANGELMAALSRACQHRKCVAIGETGLDYYYDHSPRPVQQAVFKAHIKLALELQKPLIIHCRDAYEDLLAILKHQSPLPPVPGVIHCFSGTRADAEAFIGHGFKLGIDGPVTYPKAMVLQEVVKDIPLEHFVLETDAPYLPPQPVRGKRNEPAFIVHTAEAVAYIKKVPIASVIDITTQNARQLFGIS